MLTPMGNENLSFFETGKTYYVRCITYHYVGEFVRRVAGGIVLRACSWVAESARWSITMRTGELNEVEPWPPEREVFVNDGAVVDASEWAFPLPVNPK